MLYMYDLSSTHPMYFEHASVGLLDADDGEVLAILFAQRVHQPRVGTDVRVRRRHRYYRRADGVAFRHDGPVHGLREHRYVIVDVFDQDRHRGTGCQHNIRPHCPYTTNGTTSTALAGTSQAVMSLVGQYKVVKRKTCEKKITYRYIAAFLRASA